MGKAFSESWAKQGALTAPSKSLVAVVNCNVVFVTTKNDWSNKKTLFQPLHYYKDPQNICQLSPL